jgi:hypothetical protein
MALIGNYTVLNKTPGRALGGGAQGDGMNRADFNKSGANKNQYAGWMRIDQRSSFPSGYALGYPLRAAQKAGGMGTSARTVTGAGAVSYFNLAGGLNAVAPLAGAGDINNAAAALIVSAVAALTGTGALSADILAILNAAATLAGEGDLAGALAALGNAVAILSGEGGAIGSVLTADGSMAADIVVTGDALTTANVADAILDAPDGVETGLTLRQALRVIAAATAGKVSGAETTTVTFRNALVDDVDRIIATVDSNGNRTAITLDTD